MSQDRNATPFSARSVVLSTLLGTRPPVLPARVLVMAGDLFGIAEGTIRTALSRMIASGELAADGDGGYRLNAPRLLERQARQEATTRPWRSRAWRFAFVSAGERRAAPERSGLRNAMKALRMAELREGVWLRPDNLKQPPLPDAQTAVEAQCLQAVGRPDQDDKALAARLWDLDAWADEAEELRSRLWQEIELAPGFVLSAAVLRHLQADPLLPDELLPAHWPGASLRLEYAEWDQAYRALLRDWWKHPDRLS